MSQPESEIVMEVATKTTDGFIRQSDLIIFDRLARLERWAWGNVVYCSFCGKSQHEVVKIIAGPASVFICDECVGLCTEIVQGEEASKSEGAKA